MKKHENYPISSIFPIVRYGVHRKTARGWQIAARTIPDHELVLIEKGKGIIVIEGKRHTACPGMVFYFYPGLVHSLRTDDSEPFSFFAVHFSFIFPEKVNEQWRIGPEIAKLPLQPVIKIYNHRLLSENMARLVESMNRLLPGNELMVRSMLQICIYNILRDESNDDLNYSVKAKIDIITNYIYANIYKAFTSSELAVLAKVTPDYLSRMFKKYTGYSLVEYIHHCKIERAKAYLLEENIRIKEIAQRLGFSDEFHFSKVFKKIEGISPSGFRGI